MSHIYTQCVNICDVPSKVGNKYSITIMICTGISPRCINHNHSVFIWQAGATRNFRFWCQDGWIQLGDPLSGHKSLLLLKEETPFAAEDQIALTNRFTWLEEIEKGEHLTPNRKWWSNPNLTQ